MSTPRGRTGTGREGKDTATNARADVQLQDTPDDESAGGVIVGIEQGRARRERRNGAKARAERPERPNRAEQRQDRGERRERRKGGRAETGADGDANREARLELVEAEPIGDVDGAGGAIPAATASVDAADLAGSADASGPSASRAVLVAPMMDASLSPRAIERARQQLESAEQAIANSPEVVALVAPLVRHVNTVTEQLNEAQITLGRVMAERDALRAHLVNTQGADPDQIAALGIVAGADSGAQRRLQRVEARAAAIQPDEAKPNWFRPIGIVIGFVPETDSFDGLKKMARRRQLFAAVVLTTTFTVLRILSAQGQDFSKLSRDGLADIQGVGMIFQVFLMAWMLYRIVRVGGKGVHWLFPESGGKRRRH